MLRAERLEVVQQLGEHLKQADDYLEAVMSRAQFNNQWFTIENQRKALTSITTSFLDRTILDTWVSSYPWPKTETPKRIGLILAGNIPLVGFHDLLCVFVAGHRAVVKLSDKDKFLLPYLVKCMQDFDSRVGEYISFVPTLSSFDAVIATGSTNSSRYFERYFGKYPHIIRKNRNGVGVLDGSETADELIALGEDVFTYFGLGCRNVAKLYVPEGYTFEPLLEALHTYNDIILHTKYKNNFDYNYAIFVLNKVAYIANGCIILTENEAIPSHIAGLYYEYYSHERALHKHLRLHTEQIQCVVGKKPIADLPSFPFGKAQQPAINDYADSVDTLQFLLDLH
ncbi:MAG: acyl-CoA reductase [Saprospiraceae bacterium]|nr:acyl-CoA reductase [Saprospiraceae bacterium]